MTKRNASRDDDEHGTPDVPARKPGRPRKTEPGPMEYEAIKLHLGGMTNVEIGRRLKVNPKTISRWLDAPYVQREVGKQLERVSLDLWAKISAEANEAWDAFLESLHDDDPRVRLRARIWLLERILGIAPMPHLIQEGLLAEDAVPPELRPSASHADEGDDAA